MKNLLMNAVAAIVIAGAPAVSFAQGADHDRGPAGGAGQHEGGRDAGGAGRTDAGGDRRPDAGGDRRPDAGMRMAPSDNAEMNKTRPGEETGVSPSAAEGAKHGAEDRSRGAGTPSGAHVNDKPQDGADRGRDMDRSRDTDRDASGAGAGGGDRPSGDADRNRGGGGDRPHDGGRASTHVNVNVTNEQRTTIRQTIVSSSTSVKRVSRSSLGGVSISAGARVPREVTIERLPPRIVEIVPEYRDYSYFVTDDDEIVIIDPATYEIVYVIEN